MKSVIVTVTGGVDSTMALAKVLKEGDDVVPVTVSGSPSWTKQNRFVDKIVDHYGLIHKLRTIPMTDVTQLITRSAVDGAYEDYIPGYQCFIYFPLMALADSLGIETIVAGTTRDTTRGGRQDVFMVGRHIDDDTPDALREMCVLYNKLYDTKIWLRFPFGEVSKGRAIKLCDELDVPYHLTNSCENLSVNGIDVWHCGVCHKCIERKRVFMEAGVADPVKFV